MHFQTEQLTIANGRDFENLNMHVNWSQKDISANISPLQISPYQCKRMHQSRNDRKLNIHQRQVLK